MAMRAILADIAGASAVPLESDTRLQDLPRWDSLKLIDAIASGEDAFGVDVHIRDLDRIATFGDLIAALMRATPS